MRRLTWATTSGQGRSIRYTPFDQIAAIDGVAASTSYQYDAYFNRTAKQSSSAGVFTTTTYIGNLYEKTQTASGTERRFHLYAGGRLVSLKKRETTGVLNTYYILTDHLGSVDVIADSAGTELVRMSFDVYGQRRNNNWTAGTGIAGTAITTRGFTGAEMEDEVGLVHLGARMYDAKLGRFLTPDSIIPDVENGQSLNRYSYVLNNPLSWVDPSGHDGQSPAPAETAFGSAESGFETPTYGSVSDWWTSAFGGVESMSGQSGRGGSVQGFGENAGYSGQNGSQSWISPWEVAANGNTTIPNKREVADQFRREVIDPTLDKLELGGESAADLMLGTAIHESKLVSRAQIGGGPALGLYQVEPKTHDDVWANFLAYKPGLATKVLQLLGDENPLHGLQYNDAYATAIARMKYFRAEKREDLPSAGDIDGMATYWKDYYNTKRGKGTEDEFVRDWNQFMSPGGKP